MRIRQIALVAEKLDPVVEDLCEVFGLEVGFNDPGVGTFGLCNAVLPVGGTFLEVVCPEKAGTSAGRLLDRRGGDGGYMVILQVEDLDAAREQAAAQGVRIVWETKLEDIATIHLHPRDVGAAILSLDWASPHDSWRWGGPDWSKMTPSSLSARVCGADLQSARPPDLAKRWGEVLGRKVQVSAPELASIALDDGGELRFLPDRDGRGEGVRGVEIEVRDAEQVLGNARERGLRVGQDELNGQSTLELGGAIFRLRV